MMTNIFSGFTDEAGVALDTQISVTQEIGWRHIDMRFVRVPGHSALNVHDVSTDAFDVIVGRLGAAGLQINCFGTALGKTADRFDEECAAARRIAGMAGRVGAKLARVMSYPIHSLPDAEVFRRLREIATILDGGGVRVVLENCSNYAGMGWPFALRLLENVPNTMLAFDPGNCICSTDYSKPEPRPLQDAWEFYEHLRPHIGCVHVKDGRWATHHGQRTFTHTLPGEGEGQIRKILTDLFTRGYSDPISIEPHRYRVQLDDSALPDDARVAAYVEYARRFQHMSDEIRRSVSEPVPS